MIKVLLINPPQQHYKGSVDFDLHFPIGLMHIAAMVKNISNVKILDCCLLEAEAKKGNWSSCSAFLEEIKKTMLEEKPNIVGISVHATANFKNAELIAIAVKEVNPRIITVFGGPDPSVRFKSILANQYCDYCIIGDGEETFYEFIHALSLQLPFENIKGLAYKRNGVIQYEPRMFDMNLDAIPFPAFDLVDMKRYLNNKYLYKDRSRISRNSLSIITSRGCPNHCVFCSVRLHMGQKYRSHSPEYILKLLRFCMDTYGIKNFHFEDDNLTCNIKRFEKIVDYIISEKLNINWDTPNGVRVDSLNRDLLTKMKQSGLSGITLAVESGNQRVLDEVIHKKSKLEYVIEIARQCKELKIQAAAFYVIGFPGETLDEMKDTTDLAISLYRAYEVIPLMMVATPLYGTELYEVCKRNKLIEGDPTPEELAVATQAMGNPMISTQDFSPEDVQKIIYEYTKSLSAAYRRYILKHPWEVFALWHRR